MRSARKFERRLVLLQTTIPPYRDAFMQRLFTELPGILVYSGTAYFDPTVTTSPRTARKAEIIQNHYLFGRRALWQRGAIRKSTCFADVVVCELNPRIVSTWALLAIRRLLNKPTVLWGHAFSRSGASARSLPLRLFLINLASGCLVYTTDDKDELLKQGAKCRIGVASNAVDLASDVQIAPSDPLNVVQLGRLVETKRPLLTLRAYAQAREHLPSNSRLLFVGDGPLREDVERESGRLGVSTHVEFVGECHEPHALNKVFNEAIVSVSAGYAGLSVVQSFAHGVPALIADGEPHAPEIAMATDMNSIRFKAGSEDGLAEQLINIFEHRSEWLERRKSISGHCLREHSVESMVRGFVNSVDAAARSRLVK